MGIFSWIILGLIVGALAKLVMPGRDGGGLILTCGLGVLGGFVGGWIGKAIFGSELSDFWSLRTWGLAILGALIVLGAYRLIFRGGKSRA